MQDRFFIGWQKSINEHLIGIYSQKVCIFAEKYAKAIHDKNESRLIAHFITEGPDATCYATGNEVKLLVADKPQLELRTSESTNKTTYIVRAASSHHCRTEQKATRKCTHLRVSVA